MQSPAAAPPVDRMIADLKAGALQDRSRTFAARAELALACRRRLRPLAAEWVETACRSKGIAADAPAVADEWLAGPVPVARHLLCLQAMLADLARGRLPPVRHVGATRANGATVTALPHRWLDRAALPGYRAAVDVRPGPLQQEPPGGGRGVHVVLGAGNVSSMPVCDALHAIFQRGAAVLLKLSPLHRQLQPVFERVLAPLIDAGLLRVSIGDAELGRRLTRHPDVAAWHVTGAPGTLRALLDDPEAAAKDWTAELGNVTPVVVLPGRWSERDLETAARQLAAWCASNGGCNCITPRLVLCARGWSQRPRLLQLLQQHLDREPARPAFHPGVRARYERFAARPAPDGPLPPWLRQGVDLDREPHLAGEESFAPVLAEVPLRADTCAAFADAAAGLLRERAFGALAAHVLAPKRLLAGERAAVTALLRELPHGTVAINTWAGVGYGAMTAPWGTGARAQGPATGRGFVHGTLCLRDPLRTVVTAPFRPWPAPPWNAGPGATGLARALCCAHTAPALLATAGLLLPALRRGRRR